MIKYYIVQKSNWQGDAWSLVAGPFSSRMAAKIERSKHEYHFHQEMGGIDLKSECHAKIVTRDWLRSRGYPLTPESEAALVFDIAVMQHEMEKL